MSASSVSRFFRLPRHTPPTGAPLSWAAWRAGLSADGEAVSTFEAALAAYLRVDACFTAASGRTAFYLLLTALRDLPHLAGRSEVVLPGYTCPSVAKVVLDAGLSLRLVDQEPQTLNFRPDALAAAVGEQTLAVILVHPFGLAVDVEPARQCAHAAGALLIEDVAQSLGATQAGHALGTLGDVGLFSFGPGKPLSLGGGGLLATSDATLAAALRARWAALPTAGGVAARQTNAANWLRLGLFNLAFQPTFWWWAARLGAQRVGENEASWGYRMARLAPAQAAVGLQLLPDLNGVNNWRIACARALTGALTGVPDLTLPQPGGIKPRSVYLRFPLLTATLDQADTLYQTLWQAGHGAGRMYRHSLDHFFPQAAHNGAQPGAADDLSGSRRIADTLVTLPTHHHLTGGDLVQMSQIVVSVMNRSVMNEMVM